jgi:hypothetical protein
MFLAIIGWLALVVICLYLSAGWFITASNGLGKFNIGGAENSMRLRLMILFFGCIILSGWYFVFTNAPFTVTFGVK